MKYSNEYMYGGKKKKKKKNSYEKGGKLTKAEDRIKQLEAEINFMKRGGRMPYANSYADGGEIVDAVGSGLYGLGEGILDTLTFGLTDELTDKGYEAIRAKAGLADVEYDEYGNVIGSDAGAGIRGMANAAGAVGGAVLTGGVNTGAAISEGAGGIGDALGATGNEDLAKVGKGVEIAGKVVGAVVGDPTAAASGVTEGVEGATDIATTVVDNATTLSDTVTTGTDVAKEGSKVIESLGKFGKGQFSENPLKNKVINKAVGQGMGMATNQLGNISAEEEEKNYLAQQEALNQRNLYAGSYQKGGKMNPSDFTAHMMYKDNKEVTADSYQEHMRLKNADYGHSAAYGGNMYNEYAYGNKMYNGYTNMHQIDPNMVTRDDIGGVSPLTDITSLGGGPAYPISAKFREQYNSQVDNIFKGAKEKPYLPPNAYLTRNMYEAYLENPTGETAFMNQYEAPYEEESVDDISSLNRENPRNSVNNINVKNPPKSNVTPSSTKKSVSPKPKDSNIRKGLIPMYGNQSFENPKGELIGYRDIYTGGFKNIDQFNYGGNMYNDYAGGGTMFNNNGFGANTMNEIPVNEFNAGGTHEANPLGGIPQGMGTNGKPNLVEEGELKIPDPRDPNASFIVSAQKDMIITKELAKEHNLPKKYAGKTVRKAADMLLRKNDVFTREGDTIQDNSIEQNMIDFMELHEDLTAKKEAEEEESFNEEMTAIAEKYPQQMQGAMPQEPMHQMPDGSMMPGAEHGGSEEMSEEEMMMMMQQGAPQGMPMAKHGGKIHNPYKQFGGNIHQTNPNMSTDPMLVNRLIDAENLTRGENKFQLKRAVDVNENARPISQIQSQKEAGTFNKDLTNVMTEGPLSNEQLSKNIAGAPNQFDQPGYQKQTYTTVGGESLPYDKLSIKEKQGIDHLNGYKATQDQYGNLVYKGEEGIEGARRKTDQSLGTMTPNYNNRNTFNTDVDRSFAVDSKGNKNKLARTNNAYIKLPGTGGAPFNAAIDQGVFNNAGKSVTGRNIAPVDYPSDGNTLGGYTITPEDANYGGINKEYYKEQGLTTPKKALQTLTQTTRKNQEQSRRDLAKESPDLTTAEVNKLAAEQYNNSIVNPNRTTNEFAMGGNIHQYDPNMYNMLNTSLNTPAVYSDFEDTPEGQYMQQSLNVPNTFDSSIPEYLQYDPSQGPMFTPQPVAPPLPKEGIIDVIPEEVTLDPKTEKIVNEASDTKNKEIDKLNETIKKLEKELKNDSTNVEKIEKLEYEQSRLSALTQMAPIAYNLGMGLFGKKDEITLSKLDPITLQRIDAEQQLKGLGYDLAGSKKAFRNAAGGSGSYLANMGSLFNRGSEARARIYDGVNRANTGIDNREAQMNLNVAARNAAANDKETLYGKQAEQAKQNMFNAGLGQLGQYASMQDKNKLGAMYANAYADNPLFELDYSTAFSKEARDARKLAKKNKKGN